MSVIMLLCFISAVCHYERHRNLELKIYRSDKDVRPDAHKNLLRSLRLKKICLSWEEICKCGTLVNNEEVSVQFSFQKINSYYVMSIILKLIRSILLPWLVLLYALFSSLVILLFVLAFLLCLVNAYESISFYLVFQHTNPSVCLY